MSFQTSSSRGQTAEKRKNVTKGKPQLRTDLKQNQNKI